ncbi:hypothetical protein [Tenuifilum osseticum]|uniref:hypothetical protein n=1 Tax=Tenuifilum osseticum TaxID=3374723 RepID=UPI0034E5C8CA
MKPKFTEILLVLGLVLAGILKGITSSATFLLVIIFLSILLSGYYLFFYRNNISGDSKLLNITTRWALSLFPIAFVITFFTPNTGRILSLLYFAFCIIITILKSRNKTSDRYELIRMYLLLTILTCTGLSFP